MELTTDERKRILNAMQEEMRVESRGNGKFEVKGKYTVDLAAKTCSCPDHEHRDATCKHLVYVAMLEVHGKVDRGANPSKPSFEFTDVSNVPQALRLIPQWVGWRQKLHENKDGSKRWTKVPIDIENGGFASSTGPETWTDFTTASLSEESRDLEGIGFVVTEDDAFVGIDFDDVRNPETGEIHSTVDSLVNMSESYVEVSPSGTGIRVFCTGKMRGSQNQTELDATDAFPKPHVEIYEFGRYLTVTGNQLYDREIQDAQPLIDALEFRMLSDDDAEMVEKHC